MKVVIPVLNARVSPVFDCCSHAVVFELMGGEKAGEEQLALEGLSAVKRAEAVIACGAQALICAAVCGYLRRYLEMSGVRVHHGIVGPVDEVLAAFVAGRLESRAFFMPGRCSRGPGRGQGRGPGRTRGAGEGRETERAPGRGRGPWGRGGSIG